MKTRWWMSSLAAWLCMAVVASASEQTAKEEKALDARLGLKERTFQVNMAALKTRTDLREKAQVKTGLPSYDQQVENAQSAPAALMNMLAMPQPTQSAPASAPSSSAPASSAPNPPKEDNNINNPNCYIGQYGELVCP